MTVIAAPGRTVKPWGPLPKAIRYGPYPMQAATTIYVGAVGCTNSAIQGLAQNAVGGVATLVALGIAPETYENQVLPDSFANLEAQGRGPQQAPLGSNFGLFADFIQGQFPMFNDPGAGPVGLGNIGTSCYLLDNQTVSTTAGSNSKAGVVCLVDQVTGFVIVSFDPFAGRP